MQGTADACSLLAHVLVAGLNLCIVLVHAAHCLLQASQAISAAQAAIANQASTFGIAALPEPFRTVDLEHWLPARRRQRGAMTTLALADFAAYVAAQREAGATVFVDASQMRAVAVLNLGTTDKPGHCDNNATFAPVQLAAFKALLSVTHGGQLAQKTVAEFCEDWFDFVTFDNASTEISKAQAIAAIRKITIDSAKKFTAEEASLSVERSTFESVKASSTETLPTHITFACQPYSGLARREFRVRLGVLTGAEAKQAPVLALTLRIAAWERHVEEMADEVANQVRGAVGDTPVVLGTFQASR